MQPSSGEVRSRRLRRTGIALTLALAGMAGGGTQAQLPPEIIDSTGLAGPIDDFTSHTFSVGAGGLGSFAERTVVRRFAEPIEEIHVFIVDGQADDIGYVGSTLVTDIKPQCAGVGAVQGTIEVSDQVTVSGNEASLVLRAQENCCCVTGWGSATQGDRRDARLHWQVTLGGKEYRVNVTTFIPADFIAHPTGGRCGRGRDRQLLYFEGDGEGRGFSPTAATFRSRQLATLVTDEAVDPDGIVDGSVMNLVGTTRSYAEDAVADGVLDAADRDGVLHDCHLQEDEGTASTSSMRVESVRPVGGDSVLVRLSGSPSNPLVRPSPGIDWDLFLQITSGEDSDSYLLVGNHDGFPAYEVYVNDQMIYSYSPGVPPFGFFDLFKLFPPAEIGVNETGTLP